MIYRGNNLIILHYIGNNFKIIPVIIHPIDNYLHYSGNNVNMRVIMRHFAIDRVGFYILLLYTMTHDTTRILFSSRRRFGSNLPSAPPSYPISKVLHQLPVWRPQDRPIPKIKTAYMFQKTSQGLTCSISERLSLDASGRRY